ncbi:MAG: hypothetical protein GF392_00180 [Candidatus Omnitrophica bacterium]|nr:hypothetical protein [Candidatus Omnitrophota bacterium]
MKRRLEEKLRREMKEGAVFVINNCERVGRFESLRKMELPVDDDMGIAFYTRASAERVPVAAAVQDINSSRFESGVILSNWRGRSSYVPDAMEPETHYLVYTFAAADDPRGEDLREQARLLKAMRKAGLNGVPMVVGEVHPFKGKVVKAPSSISGNRHVMITRVVKSEAKNLWEVDINAFALNRLAQTNLNFYLGMRGAGYVPDKVSTVNFRTEKGEPAGPEDLSRQGTVRVEDNGAYRGFLLKGLVNHTRVRENDGGTRTPLTVGHLCEWVLSIALFGLDNNMEKSEIMAILELGFSTISDEVDAVITHKSVRNELREFLDELAVNIKERGKPAGPDRFSLAVELGKLVSPVEELLGVGSSPEEDGAPNLTDDGGFVQMRSKIETQLVPELVNGLITSAYRGKVVLAFDSGIIEASGREGLGEVIKALKDLGLRNGRLGDFLRDVVIKSGDSAALAESLTSMVDKGLERENIVIITRKSEIARFTGFSGSSVITAVDDAEFTTEWYYPLPQVVLFSLARTLRYDRENLLRCYHDIPNVAELSDDRIWSMCRDDRSGQYRPTVVIRLVPGAVRMEDKDIYRDIARIIASAA